MHHDEKILVVVFDYLKILFKDYQKDALKFLDMVKKILLDKIKAKEETGDEETGDEESTPILDKLHENILKDKKLRQEIRKTILEGLLKNGEDDENDDVNIYRLIECFVEKNKSKKEPDK